MEGPTPISALIHAATMVTAGIFMVARMSPLFEYSEAALVFVLVIGATTAFFMGLLGVVNNDIKRVVAYSTLSQLGYMTVALGVSAYSAAIFHLMTHAFFKALLFLAAGSVIIGMHHEQDMRKMGGLAKYMPITAITSWIGALALIGTPFFAGFYSKDTIIEAVGHSHRAAATYAYWCVLAGVFVTALYTFRMLFMTFHGKERFREAQTHGGDDHSAQAGAADAHVLGAHAGTAHEEKEAHGHAGAAAHGGHEGGAHAHAAEPHESPLVVTGPLIALAIPSVIIGFLTVGYVVFGDYFGGSIFVLEKNDVLGELAREFHGSAAFALHGLQTPPFWLALAGVITAWVFFLWRPSLADSAERAFGWLKMILVNKYFFDWFNENVLAAASRMLGRGLWKGGDMAVIDGLMVDGSARGVGWLGGVVRRVQSGYLYSYAFWMIIGLAVLLGWFLIR
jgi:NADH-quinone oxidoreductase subunit L